MDIVADLAKGPILSEENIFLVLGVAAFFLMLVGVFFLAKKKKEIKVAVPRPQQEEGKEQQKVEVSFKERLGLGLAKSRQDIWGKISSLLGSGEMSEEIWDEVEETLYLADLGPSVTEEFLEGLKKFAKEKKEPLSFLDVKEWIYSVMEEGMRPIQDKKQLYDVGEMKVIMIVGINGAGKTTTVGKLAGLYATQGEKVLVGACDTFRAAAVDQLEVWAQRAKAEIVRAKEESDPSSVAFDAVKKALELKSTLCLIDTAGRLHTKTNLMDELKKMKKTISKAMPGSPHEVYLVIDAVTGQNAMRQAQEFHEALGLTGVIFTKCDGSSKAGGAYSMATKLGVPIKYIGVGEMMEDLNEFHLQDYLDSLLGPIKKEESIPLTS